MLAPRGVLVLDLGILVGVILPGMAPPLFFAGLMLVPLRLLVRLVLMLLLRQLLSRLVLRLLFL